MIKKTVSTPLEKSTETDLIVILIFFALKKQLNDKKQSTGDATFQTNLSRALEKINSAIELCLKEKPVQDVNWGTSLELNIKIASLIELLERSQSNKLAILNLLGVQNGNSVSLSDLGNVSLAKALTDSNKASS